ncbi:hypothetical protein [Actinokineospora fastidiosa]|nr:hypothetical protein [Actinokineospora fastidiosa]
MATRSGDVDPGLLLWLLHGERLTLDDLADGLEQTSGRTSPECASHTASAHAVRKHLHRGAVGCGPVQV